MKTMVSKIDHHHVPGLLKTSVIMVFQLSLLSVLLMSSLLGDSFLVTKLFRLSVNFVLCLPVLMVPQIFPLNICFSSPSALFICPKNCICLFLMVLCRDLLYPAISITSSFDFFSVMINYSYYSSDDHISAAKMDNSIKPNELLSDNGLPPFRDISHLFNNVWKYN